MSLEDALIRHTFCCIHVSYGVVGLGDGIGGALTEVAAEAY